MNNNSKGDSIGVEKKLILKYKMLNLSTYWIYRLIGGNEADENTIEVNIPLNYLKNQKN